MNSPFELLCVVNTSIKGQVKKMFWSELIVTMAKRVNNFTQAQLNGNKDFVVPFWILPKYLLPFPLDKGNAGPWNEIVKTQYVLISLLLVLIELLHGQVPNSLNLSPL